MGIGKKGDNWYCQYRVDGKKSPIKEYFGYGSAGKQAAKNRDLDIQKLKNLKEDVNSEKMFLDELGQLYFGHLRRKKRKKDYIDFIKAKMNDEWLPNLSRVPVVDLKPKDFIKVHELYDDKAPSTQNRYMDYLNIIFNHGLKYDYIEKNPMRVWWKDVKHPEKPREMTINFDEFKSIWENSADHLKWALEVMWETGVRPGPTELFSLMWNDINWEAKTIRCRGTKTKSSDRYLPITDEFKARLEEMHKKAKTEYILEYQGKRLKSVQGSFRTAKKNAKITKPCCLYVIRHLFTSESLAKGGDPKSVATILGHTSMRMIINTYTHQVDGAAEETIKVRPTLAA